MRHSPFFAALAVLISLPSPARAGCDPKCEKEYIGHHEKVECVAIEPAPSGCAGSDTSTEPSGNPVKPGPAKNGTQDSVNANKKYDQALHNNMAGPTNQMLEQHEGGSRGLGIGAGALHGSVHVDNKNKLPVGGGVGTANTYTREQAAEKLREQFEAMQEALRDNPDPRQLALLKATASAFETRYRTMPGDAFSIQEVDAIGKMYKQQMDYSRDKWEITQRPGLTFEQRQAALTALESRHASAMDGIHQHAGNASVLISALHASIEGAVREVYKPGDKPTTPGGYIPVGTLPGRHGNNMQNNFPKDPTVSEIAAREKMARGDLSGAMSDLNNAIANGGTAEAYSLRGGLHLEKKDYDGAFKDAMKALQLNPADKEALYTLNASKGRTTPGLESSLASGGAGSGSGGGAGYGGNAAGGFNPGKTREIPGMTSAATLASSQKLDEARRAMAMGDFQAAVALAQRALELNPNNAAAHNFLSSIYASRGDFKRAIGSASAGLALAPRDAALLNNKAFAENRSKLYRDALESSNHAIEADSRNPYSYANRAYAYGGLGDKASMLSDLERAQGIDGRFAQAAADAAALQLPSNADILFLFPGEAPSGPAPAAPARSKSFGLVVAAGIIGGLLMAFGLLSTVLAPLKDSVVSAFTKATRRGPSLQELDVPSASAPAAAPIAPAAIRGQYEIVRQIGAGGMGMVYEGTDRSLGRRVAIKKMRDELRLNPRERERFVIEAKTVASLHHPNIVDIYAIAEEGEDVYLVFEYVDGKTIHDLVQAQGRLSPLDSLRVTRAMGEALTYAHAHGVIHRDMKPSNVMLTSAGQVKVMDFGIARMAKDAMTRYSMTNNVVGTPPYMAPEQEQGVVRKESDVYSLAICAYEMLTGKLPFIGIGAGMLMNKINMSYIPPARAIAGLPESLDEVFLKAFQADPDQRFHSPQEFAASLEAALGGAKKGVQG